MKYTLIGKNDFLNPVKTIMENRGVTNPASLINVKSDVVIHWSKLKNINKAIECLFKHINGGGKVFVQADADP